MSENKDEIMLIGGQLQRRGLYGAAQLIFQLARERDEARKQIEDIKADMPSPPPSVLVREVPELSSGLGDGIRQSKPDTEPDKSLASREHKSLLPRSLEEMARAMNLMNNDGSD